MTPATLPVTATHGNRVRGRITFPPRASLVRAQMARRQFSLLEHLGKADVTSEQSADDQLRARRHRVATLRGLDMITNGSGMDVQQLADHPIALAARSEHHAVALSVGQRSGQHIFLARLLILLENLPRLFEREAAKGLGSRQVLVQQVRPAANGEMARAKCFARHVVGHGKALAKPVSLGARHVPAFPIAKGDMLIEPAPQESARSALGGFHHGLAKVLVLPKFRQPVQGIIGKPYLVGRRSAEPDVVNDGEGVKSQFAATQINDLSKARHVIDGLAVANELPDRIERRMRFTAPGRHGLRLRNRICSELNQSLSLPHSCERTVYGNKMRPSSASGPQALETTEHRSAAGRAEERAPNRAAPAPFFFGQLIF